MSTSTLFLNDQEIEELVQDIPLDTSIIYGEENHEFGVCPYIRSCILALVVISFHYMQIVEFVIDLRLLVCERDKTYNLP